jgi:hypothetical protein
VSVESLSVFAQHPTDNGSVLDVFIARRAYGWTTGKTRFPRVGEAECRIFRFHALRITDIRVSLNQKGVMGLLTLLRSGSEETPALPCQFTLVRHLV